MTTVSPRTRAKHRKATMNGADFKKLREQLGLSVPDMARLLALTEQTIRMIESPKLAQRPNRQTEQMMTWLCDPIIRGRVEWLEGQKK